MFSRSTLPCFLVAALATHALAQNTNEPEPKQFVLEAGPIDVQELLDRAAEFLGWNILVNGPELQNAAVGGSMIVLQNRVTTDVTGCEDMVTTMLVTKGFIVRTLNADTNLYEVIASNGPQARQVFASPPKKTTEQILSRRQLRVPVATVVQLKHINAIVATNALRPFFAQHANQHNGLIMGNVGSASTVLITGMQNHVANAILMLREADVPAPATNVTGLERQIDRLQKRVAKLESALGVANKKK